MDGVSWNWWTGDAVHTTVVFRAVPGDTAHIPGVRLHQCSADYHRTGHHLRIPHEALPSRKCSFSPLAVTFSDLIACLFKCDFSRSFAARWQDFNGHKASHGSVATASIFVRVTFFPADSFRICSKWWLKILSRFESVAWDRPCHLLGRVAWQSIVVCLYVCWYVWVQPWASAHGGKWGQLTPWKMDEKLKSENRQKRAVFYRYIYCSNVFLYARPVKTPVLWCRWIHTLICDGIFSKSFTTVICSCVCRQWHLSHSPCKTMTCIRSASGRQGRCLAKPLFDSIEPVIVIKSWHVHWQYLSWFVNVA